MQTIRLKSSQNMANYKRQGFNDIWQSYPLPPYSTVIGMIHKACDFTEYKPMQVSIQGKHVNSHYDFFTRYSFKDQYISFEKLFEKYSNPNDSFKGIGQVELLIDVNLVIHIKPEDESLFDVITEGLSKPSIYPALGRHEDILRIDDVSVVELEESDEVSILNDSYIPLSILDKSDKVVIGTVYNLNKVFSVDSKTNIRGWSEKIKVKYVKKGEILYFYEPVLREKKSSLGVFFA